MLFLGQVGLADEVAPASKVAPECLDPDSEGALPFSSGTTGVPKAVMLTHRQLVGNCQQVTDGQEFDYKVPNSGTMYLHTSVNISPVSLGVVYATRRKHMKPDA